MDQLVSPLPGFARVVLHQPLPRQVHDVRVDDGRSNDLDDLANQRNIWWSPLRYLVRGGGALNAFHHRVTATHIKAERNKPKAVK